MGQTDLLLLNASNLPQLPIYPYAFVQVSAIARRFGLSVRRLDLLQVRREFWRPMLRELIQRHRPRMVGIHLRQQDTVLHFDYHNPQMGVMAGRYFPVQDTRALIEVLREVGDMPITMGGFGFTSHAHLLLDYLGADFGVQGDPDGFFARFEDVVARRELESVPGLAYRRDGTYQFNPRGFYPPAAEREYTDEIVDELISFYGHSQLYGSNPPTVAVEAMRGCPFRCGFCLEPHVKGRRIAYRDMETIVSELEFLLSRNLRRFWFVASELNIQGSEFILKLAERVIRLNETHPGSPIEWSGFTLPRFNESDLRILQRAGYAGALNDILSLDDENLHRMQVPYRSGQAITYLKAMAKMAEEESQAQATSPHGVEGLRQRLAGYFTLFLGNYHADERTIRRSLQQVDEHGLRENYRGAFVMAATRVYDIEGKYICATSEEEAKSIISYDERGERPFNLLWPSFYYPRFLMQRLGSTAEILKFFSFVGDTFLSLAHRMRKDWNWFLSRNTSVEQLREWLAGASSVPLGAHEAPPHVLEKAAHVLGELRTPALVSMMAPEPEQKPLWNEVARVLLEHLFRVHGKSVAAVTAHLGIQADERGIPRVSEYRLMERLYQRYDSVEQLIEDAGACLDVSGNSLAMLYLQWLLYANNVTIRPEYRDLLFEPPVEPASAVG
ncbi:radical SAM protein [Archangium violaceum]|uniref:B12-binding domain-containing radical SAM protein n=1 Tax=Archangium violaceum TaxID=83451 RepID=UPI002B287EF0|nr:radical SAM protein [Archangium violaceum]